MNFVDVYRKREAPGCFYLGEFANHEEVLCHTRYWPDIGFSLSFIGFVLFCFSLDGRAVAIVLESMRFFFLNGGN